MRWRMSEWEWMGVSAASEYSLIVCQLVHSSHYEFISLNLFALPAQRTREAGGRERGEGCMDNSFSFCCNIKQLKDLKWKLIATVCGSHCKCSAWTSTSSSVPSSSSSSCSSSTSSTSLLLSAPLRDLAACQRFVWHCTKPQTSRALTAATVAAGSDY